MISSYREWIKSIREKNEFLKNISKDYIKMEKKIIQLFQDKSLGKKRPLREAGGQQKKEVFENISKGYKKRARPKG